MTDTQKPQWLIDREDERLAKSEPHNDEALLAELSTELDATYDALVPLIERDQEIRAARATLRDREHGIGSLDGIVADARENATRLLNTDTRAAVAARQDAEAASAMRAEAVNALVATRASVEQYDFDAASLAIALLVTQREDLARAIASPELRAHMLAAEADNIRAARDRVVERSVRRTKLLLESSDPKLLAEAHLAETRAATKAEHERREAEGLNAAAVSAPRKTNNAAAIALERMARGERVGNPVEMARHSSGGMVRP